MAHPRLEEIRQCYRHRCGYCGVSETETGGDLTVDHYRPVSRGGDDDEANLVYCCFRCNTYKGDFFPTADDVRRGLHILHPLRDPVTSHLRENEETGQLGPLTTTGRFHVELLRLNRPQLVELRRARRLQELLADASRLLREENEELRLRVGLLEHYLRELHHQQREEAWLEGDDLPG